MDNGKSIENFNDTPEFYKEIINCWVEFGGGQTKTPTNFREIRNQNIWGNKYIKFNNKSLIYKNWIDSNLLYVNDITDENGRVSQDYLIEKLKNKIIFFSEFSRLKKAIPKEWYVQLSEEKSVKTTINIKKENIISAGRVIDMDKLVNKDFYNIIKNKVFIKPIGIHFWTTYLDIQDFQNITDLYEFIFKILLENKLKIFRWKLLQFIIPTKSHLFKWKISTDSLCNVCKVEEDYDHFFMSCKYLDIF